MITDLQNDVISVRNPGATPLVYDSGGPNEVTLPAGATVTIWDHKLGSFKLRTRLQRIIANSNAFRNNILDQTIVIVKNGSDLERKDAFVALQDAIEGMRSLPVLEKPSKEVDLGSVSGNFTVDFSDGRWTRVSLAANAHLLNATFPEPGEYKLRVLNPSSHTLTINPAANIALDLVVINQDALLEVFTPDGAAIYVKGHLYG